MRICIFAEGSYPYVAGGVSSWVDSIIRSCPEHEFIIYSITPDSANVGNYKYDIPENVVEVKDIFLDRINLSEGTKGMSYNYDSEQEDAIRKLLYGESFSWDLIYDFFIKTDIDNVTDFFMSKNFYNIVKEMYKDKFPYTPFTEYLWTMRSMYLVLFYLLNQELPKADVYHSVSTGYAGILASFSKYLYKKPLILSEHGIYTREREEEIIKADWVRGYYKDLWISYFYNLSRGSYDSADLVTSLFEESRELQIELECPQEKIKIIPNGVDVDKFENIVVQKQDESRIYIGALLRVVPIKDIKTMLQSFEIVKKEIPNAEFFIMGSYEEDQEYYGECKRLLKQLGTEDVHFTGQINTMDYIGKMDIMLLTSISEGQPLAVMEGMAAKKPHVCTNVGDCRGLLEGRDDSFGRAGFTNYVMDYSGIAESIITLCKDEDLRNKMGLNGFKRVEKLYRRSDYLNAYKNLYKKYGDELWQV